VLRRPDALMASQVKELKPYIGDTHKEIMFRLQCGQSGLGEVAQGYQLSLFSEFYPRVTSRNCSVAAFLDDSLLPPSVAGPVVVNYRTFPIRVNNNKYIRNSDKAILTWQDMQNLDESEYTVIKGNSGGGYTDQVETTWEEISSMAGETIFEQTSLTRLPRRVFTFSQHNLIESLVHNNTGDDMYISVNFMNYVDHSVKGKRSIDEVLTPKVIQWIKNNIFSNSTMAAFRLHKINIKGMFIGTWKGVCDSVFLTERMLQDL